MKKMLVTNIFNMSFGKAFFVGQIEGETDFVRRSKWKLFVNNQFVEELDIEGEQLPLSKTNVVSSERVLAVTKHIDKASLQIGNDDIRLEKVDFE